MPSMRGFEMKVKKKNIIWLCANVAVFALFVFFFRVKFVAAAAVVYSAASVGFLTFDLCRGRTESLWCAPMVPIALMVFETEVNNPIDSFGAMLCVSVIIATVLTITAFLICKKKFAGFSVGGLRQALFLLLAALAIMGCAMTLNNTFTRGAHNVSAVVIETDDDLRTVFYDGPHRIRVTPRKGAGVDAWIDLPKERCGKVKVGDTVEVKAETGLFGVRICSLAE